jgi:prevent-host-death family protein
MKWVKASEFKAASARVAEEASTNDAVMVVKNGKAKAVLAPAKPRKRLIFGVDKGRLRILGDIVSARPEEWEWTAGDSRRK